MNCQYEASLIVNIRFRNCHHETETMYNIHCTCTLKFKQPVVESDGGRYEKDDGEDEIVNKRELGDWRA